MAINILMGDDGRIDPKVMDILKRFAEHRDDCKICSQAYFTKTQRYCQNGMDILSELSQCPSVSDGADLEKKINESN